mgnify:CR=1 FL=1|jgi:hypothetical protein
MLKIEKTEVYGWEAAIRGMRNPKNSWERSDSYPCAVLGEITDKNRSYRCAGCKNEFVGRPNCIVIGKNDLDLMTRLRNAGPEHAKFLRMVVVTCDITAPLYWWKEFDTYKVGTVANSCSTMHKIADKEFTLDDFSHEHLLSGWAGKDKNGENVILPGPIESLENTIKMLNRARDAYLVALKTEEEISLPAKDIWWQMIQLLPSSYNQKRTVFLNYWVLANIYHQRQHHKQDEWRVTFCDWIKSLPYSNLITGEESK